MPTVSEALTQAAARDPELASFYEFQGRLCELQEKAKQGISATLEMVDREALQSRLLHGLPLLAFAQLPLEAEYFAGLGTAIAQALMSYYPGPSDRAPRAEPRDEASGRSLEGQTLPATSVEWVALAERRFAENRAGQADESPTLRLAETAADLALRPYLAWAAEQIMPHLDQEAWKREYCPVCGGAPDFALLEEESGARRLVCSRCNSQWRYRRIGCPFCDTQDFSQIVYYPSEDEVYRLYVCRTCQRYLKTLDLRKTGARPVLVDVERITTVALDAAAREEGYR